MEVQEGCEPTHRLRIFICPLDTGVGVDLGLLGAAASAVGTGTGTFN